MGIFFGGNYHFGGQILQKKLGKGQSTPFMAMPGFWEHLAPISSLTVKTKA